MHSNCAFSNNSWRIFSFILSLVGASFIFGADAGIRLSGRILSEADSTAVSFAVGEVLVAEKPVASFQSDENGQFHTDIPQEKDIFIKIESPGFADYELEIEGMKKNIDIGIIYMSEVASLKEVVVTAEGKRERMGKTIVIPSAADVRASADALSFLQKLQLDGLEVNIVNRSVSVLGSSLIILIDGVPSSQDDLNALKPGDVAKVEYSRFVPARYADKNAGGVIDITLKKKNDGGSVYVWGRGCPTTGFIDGSVRGSYHQGPSQFTLSYSPSWRNYSDVNDYSESALIGNDFRVDFVSTAKSPFHYMFNPLNLKYVYSPDKSLVFSATFNAGIFNDGRKTRSSLHDSLYGDYSSNNENSDKRFTPSLDLYVRKDFNPRNSLEVEVVGTLSSTDYRNRNVENPDGVEESYVTDTDNRRRSLISEVSFVHTFDEVSELSAGFQNTVSGNDNRYLTTGYKATLTENNNYGYVQFARQCGPVYLRVATGIKLFWMRNDLNNRHFIRNLSSALASWKLNREWTLTYQFRYTPAIPGLAELTDYPQQTSIYMVSNGNPDLKVCDNFRNSLALQFNKGKWSVSGNVNHFYASHPTYSDVSYLGDGKFLSASTNFKSQQNITGWVRFGVNNLFDMFGTNVTFQYSHYESKGDDWKHTLGSFSAYMNVWWNKGPFTVSYSRKIPGKSLWGTTVSKDENWDGLQFDYKPDKHWTLGLGWMYMFSKHGTQYPSWDYSASNPGYRYRYIKENANMVCLSVTYNADFGSLFSTARRSLNNTDSGSSLLTH